MNRGHSNIVPFGRPKPVAPVAPAGFMVCPVATSRDISEAIVIVWDLREQLAQSATLSKAQRQRIATLGRRIEDRLERALHSMEHLP